MPEPEAAERIRQLETENTRLRLLLDQRGMPSALRHQVRNALGLMRVVLRRSAESKSSIEELTAHLEGRFDALLRVQTTLLSSPDGCVDLAALVSDALLAQAVSEGERATLEGQPVRIEARKSELLGLVFHELATNAVKFGPLSAVEGRVEVSWTLSPERLLELTWFESGPRPHVADAHRRGFGMDAIEGMLPYQMHGESSVEILPAGLRCVLRFPL